MIKDRTVLVANKGQSLSILEPLVEMWYSRKYTWVLCRLKMGMSYLDSAKVASRMAIFCMIYRTSRSALLAGVTVAVSSESSPSVFSEPLLPPPGWPAGAVTRMEIPSTQPVMSL